MKTAEARTKAGSARRRGRNAAGEEAKVGQGGEGEGGAAAGQPLEGLIMGALGVDKIMLDMAPSVSPSI